LHARNTREITDSETPITPDIMLDTVRDEFFRVAGRLLGDSFDRQRERTLCDDMDSFSVALGSAGTALTLATSVGGESTLRFRPACGKGIPASAPSARQSSPHRTAETNTSAVTSSAASGPTRAGCSDRPV
jgi:hypothetical protein